MVIKSLTITEEAYQALKNLKQGDESFSKIIIRISNDGKGDISGYFGALNGSKKELDEIKKNIKDRRSKINSEFSARSFKMRRSLS